MHDSFPLKQFVTASVADYILVMGDPDSMPRLFGKLMLYGLRSVCRVHVSLSGRLTRQRPKGIRVVSVQER